MKSSKYKYLLKVHSIKEYYILKKDFIYKFCGKNY